jgi:hypothetical protein
MYKYKKHKNSTKAVQELTRATHNIRLAPKITTVQPQHAWQTQSGTPPHPWQPQSGMSQPQTTQKAQQ